MLISTNSWLCGQVGSFVTPHKKDSHSSTTQPNTALKKDSHPSTTHPNTVHKKKDSHPSTTQPNTAHTRDSHSSTTQTQLSKRTHTPPLPSQTQLTKKDSDITCKVMQGQRGNGQVTSCRSGRSEGHTQVTQNWTWMSEICAPHAKSCKVRLPAALVVGVKDILINSELDLDIKVGAKHMQYPKYVQCHARSQG